MPRARTATVLSSALFLYHRKLQQVRQLWTLMLPDFIGYLLIPQVSVNSTCSPALSSSVQTGFHYVYQRNRSLPIRDVQHHRLDRRRAMAGKRSSVSSSIRIPMKRSIEPTIARCSITGTLAGIVFRHILGAQSGPGIEDPPAWVPHLPGRPRLSFRWYSIYSSGRRRRLRPAARSTRTPQPRRAERGGLPRPGPRPRRLPVRFSGRGAILTSMFSKPKSS